MTEEKMAEEKPEKNERDRRDPAASMRGIPHSVSNSQIGSSQRAAEYSTQFENKEHSHEKSEPHEAQKEEHKKEAEKKEEKLEEKKEAPKKEEAKTAQKPAGGEAPKEEKKEHAPKEAAAQPVASPAAAPPTQAAPIVHRTFRRRIATVHVFSSKNDTIITVTDQSGAETIAWASGGMMVKSDREEGRPYAAMQAALKVMGLAKEKGINFVNIRIRAPGGSGPKTPGSGAQAVVRTIARTGVRIGRIDEVTPLPTDSMKAKGGRRGRRV